MDTSSFVEGTTAMDSSSFVEGTTAMDSSSSQLLHSTIDREERLRRRRERERVQRASETAEQKETRFVELYVKKYQHSAVVEGG